MEEEGRWHLLVCRWLVSGETGDQAAALLGILSCGETLHKPKHELRLEAQFSHL